LINLSGRHIVNPIALDGWTNVHTWNHTNVSQILCRVYRWGEIGR